MVSHGMWLKCYDWTRVYSMLLADFSFGQWAVGLAMVAVCGLLILVILVQQASGGGLVGAFGGGGGGGAFGAKTGDMFTVITCSLAGLYLILAISGNFVFRPQDVQVAPAVVTSPPLTSFPITTTEPDSAAPAEEQSETEPATDENTAGADTEPTDTGDER